MKNVIGILLWYDEPLHYLERVMHSFKSLGVRRVYAMDGAYKEFAHDSHLSAPEQSQTLRDAARKLSIKLTIWHPSAPFENEQAKRIELFKQAGAYIPLYTGYYFQLDADEEVIAGSKDVLKKAMKSKCDTALVSIETVITDERKQIIENGDYDMRYLHSWRTSSSVSTHLYPRLYRRLADIDVSPRHWNIHGLNENGERVSLKGNHSQYPLVKNVYDARKDILIVNHTWERDLETIKKKEALVRAEERDAQA